MVATADRYHGTDAQRDLALRDQRIGQLERRITELIDRIDGHVGYQHPDQANRFHERIIRLELKHEQEPD